MIHTVSKALSSNSKKWLPTSKMEVVNRKRSLKNCTVSSTLSKTVDFFVIIQQLQLLLLSPNSFGLIVIPVSNGATCGLSLTSKLLYELLMNRNRKKQTNNSFD